MAVHKSAQLADLELEAKSAVHMLFTELVLAENMAFRSSGETFGGDSASFAQEA